MELSDYVFKKKEELESSVEGASNIKTLEKIAFQLFLPFTKLDRINRKRSAMFYSIKPFFF